MNLINPYGIEVIVDFEGIEFIKRRGEWDKFSKAPIRHEGTGPKNKVLLLLKDNGIGDAIHSMPAITQKIKDGFEVAVLAEERNRVFYEAAGCTFIPAPETTLGLLDSLKPQYGVIYSLKHWCISHDEGTFGRPHLARFAQFAEYIETTLPETFSWRTLFHDALSPAIDEQPTRLPSRRTAKKPVAGSGGNRRRKATRSADNGGLTPNS